MLNLKISVFSIIILFAGTMLAACSGPVSQTSDPTVTITDGKMTLESTDQNSSTNMQKGPTVKQLSDFEPIEATQATIHTNKGDITIELYRDLAPLTTLNFLTLAKEGFYDGVVFHRVIADFMAQVGDPKSKDPSLKAEWGTGGPGYTIPDEFGAGLSHNDAGIVSMANAGPNTGGSQFFITFGPTEWLDGKHAVFGKVTAGMDVVNSLTIGDTIESISYK